MGQCVFSSSGRREDDKALCAVPTPESCWQLCYSLPSSLSPPANNVLLIALFQLAAKAWRNWIMKWSCGKKKKKIKQRGSFHAKQPKTLPGFTSSGTCRSQNISPFQLLPAHPWPRSAHLCYPPQNQAPCTPPLSPRVLRAAASGKRVRVGHRLKGLLLSPAVLQLPRKKFMQTPNNV